MSSLPLALQAAVWELPGARGRLPRFLASCSRRTLACGFGSLEVTHGPISAVVMEIAITFFWQAPAQLRQTLQQLADWFAKLFEPEQVNVYRVMHVELRREE